MSCLQRSDNLNEELVFIRAEVKNHSNHYLMKEEKQYLSRQIYKHFLLWDTWRPPSDLFKWSMVSQFIMQKL